MISTELYKIRMHRTPRVIAALLLIGVLAPSVTMIWFTPTEADTYTDAFQGVLKLLAPLLAAVFGAWVMGTEYSQGTIRRLLASEPRRMRALASKGVISAIAISIAVIAIGLIGMGAAQIIGSMNDVAVDFNLRILASVLVGSLGVGVVAFSLSVISRSYAFAVIGTFGTLFILDPLLSSVRWVGDYTFGSALDSVAQAITNEQGVVRFEGPLGVVAASVTVVIWMIVLLGVGAMLFRSRDV